MNCETARTAISATLDGEDPGVEMADVRRHIDAGCAACARFETRSAETMREMRVAPVEDVPDQTAAILSRIGPNSDRRRLELARGILVGLAAVEFASGVRHFADGGLHSIRDAAAFSIALAIGLLIAAIRPVLAVGILPIVVVLAATSLVGGFVDVAAGRIALSSEMHHLIELTAAGALWITLRPLYDLRSVLRTSPTP